MKRSLIILLIAVKDHRRRRRLRTQRILEVVPIRITDAILLTSTMGIQTLTARLISWPAIRVFVLG